MLEPENNPNPSYMVDPPRLLRYVMAKLLAKVANTEQINKKRDSCERKRQAAGKEHEIEYFHQLDDPYSHLMAQVLEEFARRYNVKITPHLIRASGGRNQPEAEKLATWAHRDAGLIAPHYGLSFPNDAGVVPDAALLQNGARALATLSADEFIANIKDLSTCLWSGDSQIEALATDAEAVAAIDAGSAKLADLGHYSGAMLYYGGEWYWGVDRLFHLEQRLRDLGACNSEDKPYLVPRPSEDVSGIDASALDLHFYPSLNSPYTSIIYDRTVEMAQSCTINLFHKPVLPMIMRGVAATPTKGKYIFFDTKREADFFNVPFGHHVSPIGEPTRRVYSLLPWAASKGKDVQLLGSLLRRAWSQGQGLHKEANLRSAVEEVGLDWAEASQNLGNDAWKAITEQYQNEMVEGMGLWGVPSYRLSGPDGEPDLAVWGQDRLWLVAAEIRRRVGG